MKSLRVLDSPIVSHLVRQPICTLQITGSGGGPLLRPDECRRRAEEAEELARKSSDVVAQKAYEEIARIWREMAERGERTKRNQW